MKSWRDPTSPWARRLHFEPAEFDSMMDELRHRAGSECFCSGKGVDVDLVLLRAINVEADYVELPPGVLGRTRFYPDGRVQVEIARFLADLAEIDDLARRRLRTTLAHECGHIACHRSLYLRDTETLSLFELQECSVSSGREPIMCREEVVKSARYQGDWWEYQANQCMASLLLPRGLFSSSVRQALACRGSDSLESVVAAGKGLEFVRELSEQFDVSQSAIVFRLETLGFLPKAGAISFDLNS